MHSSSRYEYERIDVPHVMHCDRRNGCPSQWRWSQSKASSIFADIVVCANIRVLSWQTFTSLAHLGQRQWVSSLGPRVGRDRPDNAQLCTVPGEKDSAYPSGAFGRKLSLAGTETVSLQDMMRRSAVARKVECEEYVIVEVEYLSGGCNS